MGMETKMPANAQATHTPGPWKARNYKTDDGGIWIDCDSWANPKTASCRGGTIATALGSGCGNGSVEANARLIAAAPEMLEALRQAADVLADAKKRGDLGPHETGTLNAVIAAIAKASP